LQLHIDNVRTTLNQIQSIYDQRWVERGFNMTKEDAQNERRNSLKITLGSAKTDRYSKALPLIVASLIFLIILFPTFFKIIGQSICAWSNQYGCYYDPMRTLYCAVVVFWIVIIVYLIVWYQKYAAPFHRLCPLIKESLKKS